jgi:hypothetical protein
MADNVFHLLVGIGLLALSFLNVRYELARRGVRRLRWPGSFPDGEFARVFYGSLLSVFALIVGLAWTVFPLISLVNLFGR